MIKTVGDLLEIVGKTLSGAEGISAQAFIVELQKEIANLHESNAKKSEEIMSLKAQIADYDRWDKEKEKYETFDFSKLTFVYRFPETGEFFCKMCSNQKRMPIGLINKNPGFTRGAFECPNCHSSYPFTNL